MSKHDFVTITANDSFAVTKSVTFSEYVTYNPDSPIYIYYSASHTELQTNKELIMWVNERINELNTHNTTATRGTHYTLEKNANEHSNVAKLIQIKYLFSAIYLKIFP